MISAGLSTQNVEPHVWITAGHQLPKLCFCLFDVLNNFINSFEANIC